MIRKSNKILIIYSTTRCWKNSVCYNCYMLYVTIIHRINSLLFKYLHILILFFNMKKRETKIVQRVSSSLTNTLRHKTTTFSFEFHWKFAKFASFTRILWTELWFRSRIVASCVIRHLKRSCFWLYSNSSDV